MLVVEEIHGAKSLRMVGCTSCADMTVSHIYTTIPAAKCTSEDVVQLLELQPPARGQQCASRLLFCEPTSSHFLRSTFLTTHFRSDFEMVVAFVQLRGGKTEAQLDWRLFADILEQTPGRSNKPTSISVPLAAGYRY